MCTQMPPPRCATSVSDWIACAECQASGLDVHACLAGRSGFGGQKSKRSKHCVAFFSFVRRSRHRSEASAPGSDRRLWRPVPHAGPGVAQRGVMCKTFAPRSLKQSALGACPRSPANTCSRRASSWSGPRRREERFSARGKHVRRAARCFATCSWIIVLNEHSANDCAPGSIQLTGRSPGTPSYTRRF